MARSLLCIVDESMACATIISLLPGKWIDLFTPYDEDGIPWN
jgi:hypothetical protein